MTIENTIKTLFQHNLWANTRLFASCAGLSDEQLDAKIVGTYGSIRDTLRHIATSETSYLQRIRTGQPFRRPENAPPLTIAALQEMVRQSGEGLVETAPQVTAQDSVTVNWDGAPRSVPAIVILTQAINHATEHRAQVAATLTYLVDNYYDGGDELGVAWNDPDLAVPWGINDPILSARDVQNPRWKEIPAEKMPK